MIESEAVTFLRSRMCYYHTKFKQQGPYSLVWKRKRDNAIDRLCLQREIEAEEAEELAPTAQAYPCPSYYSISTSFSDRL
jgi:hypothetical protein